MRGRSYDTALLQAGYSNLIAPVPVLSPPELRYFNCLTALSREVPTQQAGIAV